MHDTDSVFDLVKRKKKPKNKPIIMLDSGPCNWSGSSVSDSLNHKRQNVKGNRRKMKKF